MIFIMKKQLLLYKPTCFPLYKPQLKMYGKSIIALEKTKTF